MSRAGSRLDCFAPRGRGGVDARDRNREPNRALKGLRFRFSHRPLRRPPAGVQAVRHDQQNLILAGDVSVQQLQPFTAKWIFFL